MRCRSMCTYTTSMLLIRNTKRMGQMFWVVAEMSWGVPIVLGGSETVLGSLSKNSNLTLFSSLVVNPTSVLSRWQTHGQSVAFSMWLEKGLL